VYTNTIAIANNFSGSKWSSRVSAICFGDPQHDLHHLQEIYNAQDDFINFLNKRSRAYFTSPKPIESIMSGRDKFGCNCFASGEELYQENIIVRAWGSILDWLNLVHTVENYAEPEQTMIEPEDEKSKVESAKDMVAKLQKLSTVEA
jgi:hypothetical protein